MRRQWFSFRREGKGQVSNVPKATREPAFLPPEAELEVQPRPGSRLCPQQSGHLQSTGVPHGWDQGRFGAPHTAPHPSTFPALQFTRAKPTDPSRSGSHPMPGSQLLSPRKDPLSQEGLGQSDHQLKSSCDGSSGTC